MKRIFLAVMLITVIGSSGCCCMKHRLKKAKNWWCGCGTSCTSSCGASYVEPSCACEPSCGCTAHVEPSCRVEPSCGCHSGGECHECACQGCGSRYWGDWFGVSHDCQDPCDCCGNWIGYRAPHQLPPGGCECGPHDLHGHHGHYHGTTEVISEGRVIHQGRKPMPPVKPL